MYTSEKVAVQKKKSKEKKRKQKRGEKKEELRCVWAFCEGG